MSKNINDIQLEIDNAARRHCKKKLAESNLNSIDQLENSLADAIRQADLIRTSIEQEKNELFSKIGIEVGFQYEEGGKKYEVTAINSAPKFSNTEIEAHPLTTKGTPSVRNKKTYKLMKFISILPEATN